MGLGGRWSLGRSAERLGGVWRWGLWISKRDGWADGTRGAGGLVVVSCVFVSCSDEWIFFEN